MTQRSDDRHRLVHLDQPRSDGNSACGHALSAVPLSKMRLRMDEARRESFGVRGMMPAKPSAYNAEVYPILVAEAWRAKVSNPLVSTNDVATAGWASNGFVKVLRQESNGAMCVPDENSSDDRAPRRADQVVDRLAIFPQQQKRTRVPPCEPAVSSSIRT